MRIARKLVTAGLLVFALGALGACSGGGPDADLSTPEARIAAAAWGDQTLRAYTTESQVAEQSRRVTDDISYDIDTGYLVVIDSTDDDSDLFHDERAVDTLVDLINTEIGDGSLRVVTDHLEWLAGLQVGELHLDVNGNPWGAEAYSYADPEIELLGDVENLVELTVSDGLETVEVSNDTQSDTAGLPTVRVANDTRAVLPGPPAPALPNLPSLRSLTVAGDVFGTYLRGDYLAAFTGIEHLTILVGAGDGGGQELVWAESPAALASLTKLRFIDVTTPQGDSLDEFLMGTESTVEFFAQMKTLPSLEAINGIPAAQFDPTSALDAEQSRTYSAEGSESQLRDLWSRVEAGEFREIADASVTGKAISVLVEQPPETDSGRMSINDDDLVDPDAARLTFDLAEATEVIFVYPQYVRNGGYLEGGIPAYDTTQYVIVVHLADGTVSAPFAGGSAPAPGQVPIGPGGELPPYGYGEPDPDQARDYIAGLLG